MTRNRLRVLHVINSMNVGGAEHLLLAQLRHGADRWESAIVCIDEAGALADRVAEMGTPLFDVGNGKRFNLGMLRGLRSVIRSWKPDVLHLHLPRSGVAGWLARPAGSRIPIVYTEHNVFEMYSRATRLLNVATYFRNDLAIAVSSGVEKSIHRHIPRAFLKRTPRVVRNGVDPATQQREALSASDARAALGLPSDVRVIGSIGNLFARKGHTFLVEAFARLASDDPSLRLVIIGSGDDLGRLTELSSRLGVSDKVSIVSGISSAGRFIRAFDVFVLPSLFEGLPVALLEAMSVGTPCIATSVGGIPEVIEDGRSGLLVPPRDVGSLASAIQRLLADDEMRARISSRGQERIASEFSIETLVAATDDAYRSLLSEG